MAAVAVGLDQDVAGGAVTSTTDRMTVEGKPVLRLGDPVARHGDGAHAAAVMASASSRLIVSGIGVCRLGDLASCGHALAASATRAFTE
jgi:uncharacterized Zn-binding protein involved in type VI secretion